VEDIGASKASFGPLTGVFFGTFHSWIFHPRQSSGQYLVREVTRLPDWRTQQGWKTSLYWIPAYMGIEGNDQADAAANEAIGWRPVQKDTRGTIQTQGILKPFDECRRLGLTPEWEAAVRKAAPTETNMLAGEIILPEGPADGKILEGDVLLQVNGELLTQLFVLTTFWTPVWARQSSC
jgi:hypothetical protein